MNMWRAQRNPIRQNWDETFAISSNGRRLTVEEVFSGWRENAAFRDFFIRELAVTAYQAFFWELPPVTRSSLPHAFECAVIGSDPLARMRADDSAFAEHLSKTSEPVASFPNLGGDALLIAPRRMSEADCYAHFAAFLRGAPRAQQHALLQRVATEAERLVAAGRRFWISTSGLGVPWVHVRLDSYPKYYQHARYADSA